MSEVYFLMESNVKDFAGDIFYTGCKSLEEAKSMAERSTMKSAELVSCQIFLKKNMKTF